MSAAEWQAEAARVLGEHRLVASGTGVRVCSCGHKARADESLTDWAADADARHAAHQAAALAAWITGR